MPPVRVLPFLALAAVWMLGAAIALRPLAGPATRQAARDLRAAARVLTAGRRRRREPTTTERGKRG
jgi:hypothetical protein